MVLTVLAAAVSMAAQQPATFPASDEWNGYRGNATLDARSSLRGRITTPAIAWKHFVGAIDVLAKVEPGAGDSVVTLDPTQDPGRAAEAADPRWGLAPPMGEVAGQVQAIGSSSTAAYADILPDVPGLEKLEFESGFNIPTVNGQWQKALGRCLAFREGQWQPVWQTEPIDMLFSPMPIVGDFDQDGRLEVAILPWHELLVLDAATGQVDARCSFTEGRSYGSFGVYDLDGDGLTEFVVLSDFAKHVDVLGYRDGKLTLLWQRNVELDISNPQKILRVTRDPVADVDGDGVKEVILNLHNDTGDSRWHLVIVNGLTGEVKLDLPDEHFLDWADVNGDGVAELLTVPTSLEARLQSGAPGPGIPAYGPSLVRSAKGGGAQVLARVDDAGWHPWSPPQPSHVNTGATLGLRGVMHRTDGGVFRAVLRSQTDGSPGGAAWGEPSAAGGRWAPNRPPDQDRPPARGPGPGDLREGGRLGAHLASPGPPHAAPPESAPLGDGDGALRVVEWRDGGLHPGVAVTGPGLEAVGLDSGGALLFRCMAAPGALPEVRATNGEVQPLAIRPRGTPLSTPVVAMSPDGPVAIGPGADDLEQTVAFRPPRDGREPEELWRVPGRCMGDNWPNVYSPVAAALRGDGGRQVLYSTAAPIGCARLVAMELDGRTAWTHDFPAIPGTPPIWNTGGLIFWQVGHFTDRQREDVLVTVRRSMMHSEEAYLLSGLDGRELWHRARQTSNRGVGGTPFAIADFDGDSLEDACSLHPSIFYILRGTTGEDIVAMDCTWEPVPAKPVYWGLPIAVSLPGAPLPSVFLGTGRRSMTGLLHADGSLAWWDALDTSPSTLPAIGDFDGDGALEAMGAGYDDGIRCYGLADGAVKWRMSSPLAGTPAGCATADLDSDGRDEAVFACGTALYCIGVSGDGPSVEWRLDMPCLIGPPAIADVDGSGMAAMLVIGRDGYMYCVK